MAVIDEMMGGYTNSLSFTPTIKYKYVLRIGGLSINIVEGKEPNWFHRWMQRICFGFRWEKIP